MRRIAFLYSLLLAVAALLPIEAMGQNSLSYLNDLGGTSYGVSIPVENGFINISNGNLHLEFPLASQSQRGALVLSERLTYDSRIWEFSPFGSHGSYHWWPYNVPGTTTSSAGWQFISGNAIGSVTYNFVSATTSNCPGNYGGSDAAQQTTTQESLNYIDPNGTVHPTNAILTDQEPDGGGTAFGDGCTSYQSLSGGTATDGSGYSIQVDGSGNPHVIDSNGTQVYPQIIDRYGNYWSSDGQGNLKDSAGRVPVIVTQNGNVTYYDVLAPNGPINNNGPRVRYTVTNASISIATNFGQSDVYEWTGPYQTPVQSIGLPDGSQYSFTYDSYGGLTSMTLPTGGTIHYGYSNFVDSSNTANRWLTSHALGSDPAMTFTPSVVTSCSNYSTGCVEQVTMHKPSGDENVYQLTLNNGAWNTAVKTYTGTAGSGQQISQTANTNVYTSPCSGPGCYSGNYLSQSLSTTTLYPVNVQSQTQSFFNSTDGKPSAVKQWDFIAAGQSFSSSPNRETDYTYTGHDLSQTTMVDQSGQRVGQTTYSYTSSATATTGITQHGTTNAGGPYLQTISQWIDTTNATLSKTLTYDDAGTLLSSADPNGTTSYGHDATDILVTGATLPTASSGVTLANSATYDASSAVLLTQTDPNGTTTSYSGFDALSRPTEIDVRDTSSNLLAKTTYTYSPTQIGVHQYQNANTFVDTETLYDAYGRPSRSAVNNGQSSNPWYQQDTCYDSSGRPSFQSTPYQGNGWSTAMVCSGNSAGTTTTYDALGRPSTIVNADGTTQYSYAGRAVQVTDVNGVKKLTQTDAFGRTTTACEISSSGAPSPCGADLSGNGYSATYSYDTANHKTTVSQSGQSRTFQTDAIGRTIYTKEPERGETFYSYSYTGNGSNGLGLKMIRTRARQNQTDSSQTVSTTTQYDSLGRAVSITYNDGSPGKSYSYDQSSGWSSTSLGYSKGMMTNASGGGSSMQFVYDAAGNVTKTVQCLPSWCGNSSYDVSRSYGYDLSRNLTSVAYNTHAQSVGLTYGYNLAGQVTSLTGGQNDGVSGPNIWSVAQSGSSIGPFGPTSLSLGNGVTPNLTYDGLGRYTSIDTGAFHAWGALQGNQVPWSCDTTRSTGCNNYGYDEWGRLSSNLSFGTHIADYEYDVWGNRVQQNSSGGYSTSFTFDAATNHIVGFSYDVAGNLTTDGLHSYTYDPEGNVTAVDGGSTASYTYDALNHRVMIVTGGSTRRYSFDLNGKRANSWREDVSMESAQYYVGSVPVAFWSGSDGHIHFQHQDWMGTERARSGYTGGLDVSFASQAFGDGFSSSGPYNSDLDRNHFATLDHDTESNTDHAQFRQYSPVQGRWMSPDPYDGSYDSSDPQSLNRYAYVGNNPLSAVDPSGLCGQSWLSAGPDNDYGDESHLTDILGCIKDLFSGDLFSHPKFTGSTVPRPGQIWDERGSYHAKPYSGPADILGLGNQGCEFGACGFQQGGGWEIDKRPLQGVPFAQGLGLFHYYFYNTSTHESVGLGPAKGSGMFCPVPGKFETNEKRGTLYLPIPSASQQKCVDEKLRHRGSPGNYTFYDSFGDRGGSMNCHGYVSSVVAACALQ